MSYLSIRYGCTTLNSCRGRVNVQMSFALLRANYAPGKLFRSGATLSAGRHLIAQIPRSYLLVLLPTQSVPVTCRSAG